MKLLDRYFYRKTVQFCSRIREAGGYPPVTKLDYGRPRNTGDCPVVRTIAAGHAEAHPFPHFNGGPYVFAFGREWAMPWAVERFIKRFDKGAYPELRDTKPLRMFSSEGYRSPAEQRAMFERYLATWPRDHVAQGPDGEKWYIHGVEQPAAADEAEEGRDTPTGANLVV